MLTVEGIARLIAAMRADSAASTIGLRALGSIATAVVGIKMTIVAAQLSEDLEQTDADVYLVRDQMIVYVRDPWKVGDTTWGIGSLVAMPVDDYMSGKRDLKLVFKPGATETMEGISATRDYLLVTMLNNVRGELRRYSHRNGAWTFEKVPAADMGSASHRLFGDGFLQRVRHGRNRIRNFQKSRLATLRDLFQTTTGGAREGGRRAAARRRCRR